FLLGSGLDPVGAVAGAAVLGDVAKGGGKAGLVTGGLEGLGIGRELGGGGLEAGSVRPDLGIGLGFGAGLAALGEQGRQLGGRIDIDLGDRFGLGGVERHGAPRQGHRILG